MKSNFKLLILVGVLALATQTYAETISPFQVLPWNGYKSAISLTFDDGDPIHLDLVFPELQKRKLRATFFLITNKLERLDEWKKLAVSGQEIGNHTLDHKHVSELKPGEARHQVNDAKDFLEKTFGKPILTFDYPFVEITPELKKWVDEGHFIARGGFGSSYSMNPDSEPDWLNIPSRMTATGTDYGVYEDWMDQNNTAKSWMVFMIHGVEGTKWGYQPIPAEIFLRFMDYLADKKNEIWTAPFGEVGAYWKGQKTLEGAKPKQIGTTVTWNWKKPANFPAGVVLKVRIDGKDIKVSQTGKPVAALSPGVYPVALDAGNLTAEKVPWKLAEIDADLPPSTPK